MGFFKDFKDDFSQAVNELMPGEDNLESTDKDDDMVVNTSGCGERIVEAGWSVRAGNEAGASFGADTGSNGGTTENKRRIHTACNGSSTGGKENG